jgi:hypothetical protein
MVLVANAKIELEPMPGGSSESRSVRPFATNINLMLVASAKIVLGSN